MKTKDYFDLTEPVELVTIDHDEREVCLDYGAWAAIDPVIPSGERVAYQADQRILKGCYRVWIEKIYRITPATYVRWLGKYYRLLSEPVQDPQSPWQIFIIEEEESDIDYYAETM